MRRSVESLFDFSFEQKDDDEPDDNKPDDNLDEPSDKSLDKSDDSNNPVDTSKNIDDDAEKNNNSKFGIEIDNKEPTIDDILQKIEYYHELNNILNDQNMTKLHLKFLIRYWLNYWIFLVPVETTRKLINSINKEINKDG